MQIIHSDIFFPHLTKVSSNARDGRLIAAYTVPETEKHLADLFYPIWQNWTPLVYAVFAHFKRCTSPGLQR